MTRKNSVPLLIALLLGAAALTGCASDDIAPAPKTAEAGPADIIEHPGNLNDDIRHAEAQRAAHDLAGATHTLSQLMLVAPDNARVVGDYGKVLAERGRSREAVDFLTRAMQLKSDDWSVYSALGVADDQLGKPKEARAAYEQALALKPNEPSVLNNYALSCLLANDPASAERLIHMAVAHGGGSNPKIMRNIALIDSVAAQTGVAAPASASADAPAPAAAPAIAHRAPTKPVQEAAMQPIMSATKQSAEKPALAHSAKQSQPHAARHVAWRPAHAVNGVVMQAVPFDAKAGPVAAKAKAAPEKHAIKHEEKREAVRASHEHAPHERTAHKHNAHPIAIREAKKADTAKLHAKTKLAKTKPAEIRPVKTKPAHHAELASRSAPPPLRMSANDDLP